MQEITYKQAAELLGCEYITIRQAVSSGRLTRCANKTTLLREQVALFKGKRGITMHALTVDEKNLWDSYRDIAQSPELLSKINIISMTSDDVTKRIVADKEEYYLIIKSSREAIESLLKSINNHPPMPLVHQN